MLVRVLGEVTLLSSDGSPVRLPGHRQAVLLAALTARAGQAVSADRLIDLLWSDEAAPSRPAAALHSTVFKLRAHLAGVSDRELLLTLDGGYLLDLAPDDVDAAVFTTLVQDARDHEPADAAETLARGLALWRGRAYGDLADTEIARLDSMRLDELRRVASERYAAAMLAAGRPADAVAFLAPFVAEHPLREAARSTLMEALHAQGRTSDALDSYQDFRRYLAEELGLEPSAALQGVQRALLSPPSLAAVPAGSGARVASSAPAGTGTSSSAGRRGLPELQVRYLRTDAGSVLAYGTTGNGPPVVVILGWVSSLDVIASGRDPRSSLLERLTAAATLTLYDRAGTGLSPGPVADYGLEAAVGELTDVVRAVGPPVSLLAMSASGPVALTLAHRRPEWVDSLVLFGTFANGPSTFGDVRMREMVVEIARTHWGLGSKMLADMYRPGLSDEAAWHLAKVFRDSASPEVAAAYLEAIFPQDVSALLPEIEAPALVLHYRSDRLIWFRGGQELAAGLPNATFLPLDGHVHLPDAKDLDSIEQAVARHVRAHATR